MSFFFPAVGSKGKELFRLLIGENGGEGDYIVKASSCFLDQGLISEETSRKILKKNEKELGAPGWLWL